MTQTKQQYQLCLKVVVFCTAGLAGTEESQEDGADEVDKETIHRLCPTYATDINSPLRHVRTRIYFTSESHVHSLLNVLRYSHLSELSMLPV